MGKKENPRISINAFERVAKENFNEAITESWFDIEVQVKKTIAFEDMLGFVSSVVDYCFLNDGTFMPEVMDFAIKSEILTRYANFTMPKDIRKQYWLVYNTNAYQWLIGLEQIDTAQLAEIETAINRKVKHLCDTDMITLRARLTEFINTFDKIQKETSNIFDAITPEDAQAVMDSVSGGVVSEEKLVNAYADRMGYPISPDEDASDKDEEDA